MGEERGNQEGEGKKKGGFYIIQSPGGVDVTEDDPEMLRKFTEETGTDLNITQDPATGKRIAKIESIVVIPETKKK